MLKNFKLKGFYFILDPFFIKEDIFKLTKEVIKLGIKIVQYRNKVEPTKKNYNDALILRKICKNVFFIINDRIDIALAVDADGVHIGQDDLPINIARKILGKNKIIGVSTHSQKEAIIAKDDGADYISVGPIFKTSTKPNLDPVGIDLLKKIKKKIDIPIVAIGGINLENAKKVLSCGVESVCAISSIFKGNPIENVEKIQSLFKNES
ncbi:MAG: thiamine phosphate synthase [Candidatus Omnitrophica bacterium]|nr:thiamine phosphate synthase [Candidatus Omnitrophota bacterium]MCM8831302.1 thiamine phosphate synthase [Candidatus Omnitrophota bacterium]